MKKRGKSETEPITGPWRFARDTHINLTSGPRIQATAHSSSVHMSRKWLKRLSVTSSRRQRDEDTEAEQTRASQTAGSLGRSSAPEGTQGAQSVPSTPRRASGSWIRRLSLPGGRQSFVGSSRQTADALETPSSSQPSPWIARLSFGASKASKTQSGGAGSGAPSTSQPQQQTGWLRRWSLPSTSRSDANAVSERSSVSAAPQQMLGKLSRRSWPFSRPSLQADNNDEDPEEDACAALQNSLGRVSIVRDPVGGGEYKGSLPQVNGLPGASPRNGQLRFEDAIIADILVKVFQHLTLEEIVRSAAGVNRRWYSLATSNAVWQPRLEHCALQDVFQPPIKYHSAIAQLCGFNLLVNPGLASWGISSVGPISKGGRLFASKRTWQAQINCWSTYALSADSSRAHLPKMMSDITRSGPASVLVLSTPSWASPEAVQTVDLVDMLVRRGMKPGAAAAFLDTCPPLSASVWVKRGMHLRGAHLEGYAAVVLDKGRERGAYLPEGLGGLRTGSVISAQNSMGYWFSWAPDDSVLKACKRERRQRLVTPYGTFSRLSTTFTDYGQGLRRVHFMLKGISNRQLPTHTKLGSEGV
ncbi:hypothetical protein WJX73_007877 [Symbiochloris irregularis]|uniref:F-box domain-containing protein n=1 Tax=Symbiochloris irregularis TaxID=706552 RepID=A0AAW1PIC7_9CHLO